jgi:hypothetical protein
MKLVSRSPLHNFFFFIFLHPLPRPTNTGRAFVFANTLGNALACGNAGTMACAATEYITSEYTAVAARVCTTATVCNSFNSYASFSHNATHNTVCTAFTYHDEVVFSLPNVQRSDFISHQSEFSDPLEAFLSAQILLKRIVQTTASLLSVTIIALNPATGAPLTPSQVSSLLNAVKTNTSESRCGTGAT